MNSYPSFLIPEVHALKPSTICAQIKNNQQPGWVSLCGKGHRRGAHNISRPMSFRLENGKLQDRGNYGSSVLLERGTGQDTDSTLRLTQIHHTWRNSAVSFDSPVMSQILRFTWPITGAASSVRNTLDGGNQVEDRGMGQGEKGINENGVRRKRWGSKGGGEDKEVGDYSSHLRTLSQLSFPVQKCHMVRFRISIHKPLLTHPFQPSDLLTIILGG